jgi:hypothetical protein
MQFPGSTDRLQDFQATWVNAGLTTPRVAWGSSPDQHTPHAETGMPALLPHHQLIEPVGNLMGLQGALDELGVWEIVFHK